MDLVFFVGDIIMGAGLRIFGQGHLAQAANAKSQFLAEVFSGNYAIISEPLIGHLAFLVQKLWARKQNVGKKSILFFFALFDTFAKKI